MAAGLVTLFLRGDVMLGRGAASPGHGRGIEAFGGRGTNQAISSILPARAPERQSHSSWPRSVHRSLRDGLSVSIDGLS
jgi:hypothetical protein